MNPFDQPPNTTPVPLDPPTSPMPNESGGRGRMAVVAFAAAGLAVGGVIGISELVSADRPTVQTASSETSRSSTLVEPTGDDDEAPGEGPLDGSGDEDVAPTIDGQIVIDTGDGDPIVIDLGDGTVDGEPFERVLECVPFDLDVDLGAAPLDPERLDELFDGLPIDPETFDLEELFGQLPFDALPPPGGLDDRLGDMALLDGTHITIVGPDGVTIVDLGDGDGSVTITQEDGQVAVTTQGDAEVTELPDLGDVVGRLFDDGDLGRLEPGELPEWVPGDLGSWFDDLEQCLADATED